MRVELSHHTDVVTDILCVCVLAVMTTALTLSNDLEEAHKCSLLTAHWAHRAAALTKLFSGLCVTVTENHSSTPAKAVTHQRFRKLSNGKTADVSCLLLHVVFECITKTS